MVKAVIIVLSGDIPDTEMEKAATVAIETRNYTGKVAAIINYVIQIPASTQVVLEGVGLKVPPA